MKVQTTGGTPPEDVGVKLCGVPESVALTVNAYVPFVVALPVIAPDALRLRFGGKLPLARLQDRPNMVLGARPINCNSSSTMTVLVLTDRIVDLLKSFELALDDSRLSLISTYIDLLIRWNARINLTAIRDPEEIVTRHFGESLFTAKCLFPAAPDVGEGALARPTTHAGTAARLIDVGSGPGFPGLPIKIWNLDLQVTLIESNQKKATFLREVVRTLTLTDVNVFAARAETRPPATADLVTLRAVERFDESLTVAANLVVPGGRLALLIGSAQVEQTSHLSPHFDWRPPISIPNSRARVLLLGDKNLRPH